LTGPREDSAPLGTDPLDFSLERVHGEAPPRRSAWPGSRLALGLSPTPLPWLLLPIGIALGPQGLRLISPGVLSFVDPVVSVALAALGVLIGLGLDLSRPGEARLFGAASVEAGVTILLVGAAVLLVGRIQPLPELSVWLLALLAGICASTSSTAPGAEPGGARAIIARVGDLDDVLPIVLGGAALALIREASPGGAAWIGVQAVGLALAIAYAGWLLVAQSSSKAEQRVFIVGTILLLGGIAEFLSLSALLAGLAAGTFWTAIGGDVRDRIARDVGHMQHPLVVLVLLIAGARVGFSPSLGAVVLAYLAWRVAAKLAGGQLVRRLVGGNLPRHLGLHLLSPGVIAVAFALNVTQTGGALGDAILTIAVAGSIGSELLSLLFRAAEPSS
jgi:hypothetical protein